MAGTTATPPKTQAKRAAGANGAAPATKARAGTRAAEVTNSETRASPPWKQPKHYRQLAEAFGKLDAFNLQVLERLRAGEAGLADIQQHCGIKADNGAGTLAVRQYLEAWRRAGWIEVNKDGGEGNFRYLLTPRGRAMADAFAPLYWEFGGNAT